MKEKHAGVFFCILCCVGMLGFGLFSLPTAAAHFGSTFFWGYIALGAGIAFAAVLLFCAAFEKTVCETCCTCFPRAGRWLSVLYAISYTAVSAFLFAYYAYTVQNWFLDGVPRVCIALFLIAVCLYTATKPGWDAERLVGFIGVFVLLTVLVMRLVMLFSGDMRNLMPVFEAESLAQLPGGAVFISGFFVLAGLHGIWRAPRRVKLCSGAAAVLLTALLFLLAAAGCISVLGPVQTARHLNSTVLAMKNMNLSKMDFLQRGDMVFIVTWSFLIPGTGTLSCRIPYRTVREVFPDVKRGWLFFVFFLLYALSSAVVQSEASALVCLIYTAVGAGMVSMVALPIAVLLAKRREKR